MARLGDAVYRVTRAVRVNYALFGNVEPALHAHVFPRYADEPAHLAAANPWGYDWGAAPRFDAARDHELMEGLRADLSAVGG
jgi:diadenosine tetraphosphate (Ap4A) HIT family hydrolase